MEVRLRSRDGDPWYLGKPNDVHGRLPGMHRVSVRCLRVSGLPYPLRISDFRLSALLLQDQSRYLRLGTEIRVSTDNASG